jgi:hypothetical protein
MADEHLAIRLLRSAGPGRAEAERLIEQAYAHAYGGVLSEHYPTLICVEDGRGRPRAAAGVRLAREAPLFLEQYLDEAIEAAAGRALGWPAPREAIAEIGNLASQDGAASARLYLALAEHLNWVGCTHAAVTATQRLRRKFQRLGFVAAALGPAQADRLADASDWGCYYASGPQVLIGRIAPALVTLRACRGAAAPKAAA